MRSAWCVMAVASLSVALPSSGSAALAADRADAAQPHAWPVLVAPRMHLTPSSIALIPVKESPCR